jgi:hypothetical protein
MHSSAKTEQEQLLHMKERRCSQEISWQKFSAILSFNIEDTTDGQASDKDVGECEWPT